MHRTTVEDIYELSPLQQGMLFHTLLEPSSRLYFEQIILSWPTGIEPTQFERAWQSVVAAQPVLRTSFHWEEADKPLQVVHPQAKLPIEYRSLAGLDAATLAQEVERFLRLDRNRGFDLQVAPLFRIAVLDVGPRDKRLVFSFHHVILDGWSLQLLFRQFSDAYQALLQGRQPVRQSAPAFHDYIGWLQSQDHEEPKRYWQRLFQDFEALPVLADGRNGPAKPEDFFEHEAFIDVGTTGRYRQVAARHKLTLNTLVQAAWALLLHHMSGATDVAFGVVVSGRPPELPRIEQMVGLFINTVPLRTHIDERGAVLDWLTSMQARQFEARRYDFTPLVQVGGWIGWPARRPLFDSIVGFENYPVGSAVPDAGFSSSFIERTNYPLTLVVVPGERMHIKLLSDRRAVDDASAEALLDQFLFRLETLTECLEQAPMRAIGSLPRQSPADSAAIAALNDTRADYPSNRNIAQLFEARVDMAPDAVALDHGGRPMSYRDLDHAANRLAHELQARGVRAGDPVALLLDPSAELVIAMLGVLKASAHYVPLEVGQPEVRLAAMLANVGARHIIAAAPPPPELTRFALSIIRLDEGMESAASWPSNRPRCLAASQDVAYVMHTSGSTGHPKGIAVPHRAVARLVCGNSYLDVQPGDRIGHHSNPAFDATTFEVWGALLNGAAIAGIARNTILQPDGLAATLAELEISHLFVTTAILNQTVLERPDAFSGLRCLLFGGELADPGIVSRLGEASPEGTILHVYGPTESTTFATAWQVKAGNYPGGKVPIGRPISNTTGYVLDPRLQPVPRNGVGELFIGGDGLAHGYVGDPARTADRFVPDPFSRSAGDRMYATGDKVRWRGDNNLEFVERLDRQIKVRGFRIEPGEIEQVLTRVPGVRQAVVVAHRRAAEDHEIWAYVVTDTGLGDRIRHDAMQRLREQLPSYMIPQCLSVIDALPVNRNGKVDCSTLPEPDRLPFAAAADAAPCSDVEVRLASIWRHVLGIERIGVHDSFFELGGHSLRATQIVSRVRREFGIDLPLGSIFDRPTIAGLARLIDTAGEPPAASGATPEPSSTPHPNSPVIGRVDRAAYASKKD